MLGEFRGPGHTCYLSFLSCFSNTWSIITILNSHSSLLVVMPTDGRWMAIIAGKFCYRSHLHITMGFWSSRTLRSMITSWVCVYMHGLHRDLVYFVVCV